MGKRIIDSSLTELTAYDSSYFLLVDKSANLQAKQLSLGNIGNAVIQGSTNESSWHDTITTNDLYLRLSSDSRTNWIPITTKLIKEETNLYYTEARVNSNSNVAAATTFRTTPSTVITAGTNLAWSGNTLNVTGIDVTPELADIDDIDNVTITTPTTSQVLTYDSNLQKWINNSLTNTIDGVLKATGDGKIYGATLGTDYSYDITTVDLWTASTVYVKNQLMRYSHSTDYTYIYVCKVAHTSSLSINDDIQNGKWVLYNKLHDVVTAGAGISLSGQQVTNSDTGSAAITTHESTYNHAAYLTSVTAHSLLSSTHSDTTPDSVVRGDIIVGKGDSVKWSRLALGALNSVLISDGTNIGWTSSAIGTMMYESAGSYIAKSQYSANTIVYGNGSGLVATLSVGEQTLLGRVAGSTVSAITIDSDLTTTSSSDDTIPSAKAAKAYADTKQSALTFGIANTNSVIINDSDATSGQFTRFTSSGIEGVSSQQVLAENLMIVVSADTVNIASGAAKYTFRMPFDMTLSSIRANVSTAPVGASIIVNVNKNGVSIFSTKLSIDASEKTSVTAASQNILSTTSFTDDDEITVDIDQTGTTVAGKGLKLLLKGYRTIT